MCSLSPVAKLGSGQLAEKCFLLCPEYCQFPNKARPQGLPHKSVALATPVARPGAGVGTPEANRQTEHHANVGRELKAQADRPKRPSRENLQVTWLGPIIFDVLHMANSRAKRGSRTMQPLMPLLYILPLCPHNLAPQETARHHEGKRKGCELS